MADWPPIAVYDDTYSGCVSTASVLSTLNDTVGASGAWPSANTAYFLPFRVAERCVAYKMAMGAGGTASGNFDIGIYDSIGTRVVSSGTTVKGSGTEQIIDITDTTLNTGLYYLAMSADSTDNYVFLTPSGTTPVPLQKARLYGVVQMASAFVLPATATFAALTTPIVPFLAAYLRPY